MDGWKRTIYGNTYTVEHAEHNNRQYVIYCNGKRIGTYDSYAELDDAFEEITCAEKRRHECVMEARAYAAATGIEDDDWQF